MASLFEASLVGLLALGSGCKCVRGQETSSKSGGECNGLSVVPHAHTHIHTRHACTQSGLVNSSPLGSSEGSLKALGKAGIREGMWELVFELHAFDTCFCPSLLKVIQPFLFS